MTDPRFFRKYLDILDEEPLPAGVNQPATINVGNNTTVTADPAAKTVAAKTNVGGTDISATRDLGTGKLTSVDAAARIGGANIKTAQDFSTAKQGAGTVSVDAPVAPGTTAGATYTQQGYKGQMAPSSQVRMSYTDTTGAIGQPGQTHNVRIDKGVGYGGAGKNIQPGQNIQTTYTKT